MGEWCRVLWEQVGRPRNPGLEGCIRHLAGRAAKLRSESQEKAVGRMGCSQNTKYKHTFLGKHTLT